eukprot:4389358-Amphidinium_carterae.2
MLQQCESDLVAQWQVLSAFRIPDELHFPLAPTAELCKAMKWGCDKSDYCMELGTYSMILFARLCRAVHLKKVADWNMRNDAYSSELVALLQ